MPAGLVVWNIDDHLNHRAERTNINVAFVDDAYACRIARLRDRFPTHRHDSDESWFVYRGKIRIDSELGAVLVAAGEGVVVPAGATHSVTCLEEGTTVLIVNRRNQQTFPDSREEFEAAGAVDIDVPTNSGLAESSSQ